MTCATREIETKFDVTLSVEVPDLSRLPGVAAVDPPVVEDLAADYLDTSHLDLLRAGITLRRRSGGHDAGWHLKLPWRGARCELREPYTDGLSVPESLRSVVRGLTRDRDLGVVATVHTTRTLARLRAEGGAVVAEFSDDRVRADGGRGDSQSPITWREWELELAAPNAELAERGARSMCAAGAVRAVVPSKLARVLPMPEDRPAFNEAFGPSATVAEILQAHLYAQVETIRGLDPVVRADLPDAVHQMRVTARRLRSVLAAYRPEFDLAVTEPVRTELAWLIGCLGRARDLEVLRGRVQSAAEAEGEFAASMVIAVVDQQHEAHGDAIASMLTPRYFLLLDALEALAARPPWTRRARRPAQGELVACLHQQWRRFNKTVDVARDADESTRAHRLHNVRRAAKRLRYATEAAGPALGGELSDVVDALSQIQDVLGHHHDAIVAAQYVSDTAPRSTDHAKRALDAVERRLAQEAASDAKIFDHLYRRLRRSAGVAMLR